MHESACQNALSRAVAEVDKGAAWHTEGIVPRVGISVLLSALEPLEGLEDGLELDFAVREADLLQALLIPLSSTLSLADLPAEVTSDAVVDLGPFLYVLHIGRPNRLFNEFLAILDDLCDLTRLLSNFHWV